MSIPLDNLYNWIEGLSADPVVLYIFLPHGSKKISDLGPICYFDSTTRITRVPVICYDQEPLNFNMYENVDSDMAHQEVIPGRDKIENSNHLHKIDLLKLLNFKNENLNTIPLIYASLYDKCVILHSEKNSDQLKLYQDLGCSTAYYWSHAVIARDWYRFAEIDTRLNQTCEKTNEFLIYCRDWSDGREYRLKFLELLIAAGLHTTSKVSMMKVNSAGNTVEQHQFVNAELCVTHDLSCISDNHVTGSHSAGYEPKDFVSTNISVVLETEFDGSRIHLTEKILRPIACAHPFILAAGPGSLQYLRDYGFETYSPWIDESYDLETNSARRLEKIVSAMKQFNDLPQKSKTQYLQQMQQVALKNQQRFFSKDFFEQIKSELEQNLNTACKQASASKGKNWRNFIRLFKQQPEFTETVAQRVTDQYRFLRQLRKKFKPQLQSF